MIDPVSLGTNLVAALDNRDIEQLHQLVPAMYWDWVDQCLDESNDWSWWQIESFAGRPRSVVAARPMRPGAARLIVEGPLGAAYLTVSFDDAGELAGFSLDAEEFEGIGNIVITCPDERVDELRSFYEAILGERRGRPRLVFDEGRGYVPPQWPDPHHPQQMHLDLRVTDIGHAEASVLERGGTLLRDGGGHRTYSDPIGHPFCLYPSDATELWRVVIDCPEPAALDSFYRALLGPQPSPTLAFQEVNPYVAPTWPDPTYGAHIHFDIRVDDPDAAITRIAPLGGVRLPPQGGTCPVYADPAGHPFCLCFPGE